MKEGSTMPERCDVCHQFKKAGVEHVCRKPGPRPSGNAKWRTDSPEAKAYRAEYARRYRSGHEETVDAGSARRRARRDERLRLRAAVLIAYSGEPPTCACCGERQIEFLVLDHVNGGGNQLRKAEGHKGGTQQYRRLRSEGWPAGYRVLCWNCNAACGLYGYCPHQE